MIVHLLKNMEVKVRDIHVRYEDSTPGRGGTLAAGVTLHSLELKVRGRGRMGRRREEGGRESRKGRKRGIEGGRKGKREGRRKEEERKEGGKEEGRGKRGREGENISCINKSVSYVKNYLCIS